MFCWIFKMLIMLTSFMLASTEPPTKSSKELLEEKLRQNGFLPPNQELSQADFLKMLDRIQSAKPKPKKPEGLYTADGEYIPPEKVSAYFQKMGGTVPR